MALLGSLSSGVGEETYVDSTTWVLCHVVPVENTNTSTRQAFVVHGTVGIASWGANTERAQVEVALATLDASGAIVAVDAVDVYRQPLRSETVSASNSDGGRCALPFHAVLVLDDGSGYEHPQFGGAWKTSDRLAVVARVNRQQSSGTAHAFRVNDVVVLAFDLAELDAEGVPYDVYRYRPAQPQNLTTTFRELDYGKPLAASAVAGELYLVFHSYTFRSYTGSEPLLQIAQNDGGTSEPIVRDAFGIQNDEHPAGVPASIDIARQTVAGGFAVCEHDASGLGDLGFRARDIATGTFGTAVKRATWLAIRLRDENSADDFYNVAIDDDLTGRPEVAGVFNYPIPAVPFETTPVNPTRYVLLTQARGGLRGSGLPGRLTSFRHLVTGGDGSPVVSVATANVVTRVPNERVPYQAYVQGRDLQGDAAFGIVFANGIDSVAIPEPLDAYWYRAVGFSFETDPSSFNLPPVTPGAVVYLVPSRESLDVSDLEILPREPLVSVEESQDVPSREFYSDVGYRWRVPRLVSARRWASLTFPGLSASERDSLLAFFRDSPAFAWTPPREIPRPWLVVERPTASPDGILYTVSVRVLELVYTESPS